MNEWLQGKRAMMAAAALILLAGLAANSLLFAPLRSKIQENQTRILSLEERVRVGLKARREVAQIQQRIAELKRENQQLSARLPERERFVELAQSVVDTAEGTMGLYVRELKRGRPAPAGNLEGVHVGKLSLRVRGRFADLYRFLAYLEGMKRFSRIAKIEITPAPNADPPAEVEAEIALEFFFQSGGKR